MKKIIATFLLPVSLLFACSKGASDLSSVSLTASSNNVSVGEKVTVSANTTATAVSWTVTPSNSVSKTYTVSTEKTNYFTFLKAGDYVIGVRAKEMKLDTVHQCNPADSIGHHVQDSVWNHHIDSLWHRHGNHLGGCKNGIDSASVTIHVN